MSKKERPSLESDLQYFYNEYNVNEYTPELLTLAAQLSYHNATLEEIRDNQRDIIEELTRITGKLHMIYDVLPG